MKNAFYGKTIDKLRFRLFEIGLQITEKQALFYVAKAWQLLQKHSYKQYKQLINSTKTGQNAIPNHVIQESRVLKLALSMAYKNQLPRLRNQSLKEFTHTQIEQLAIPTAKQLVELDKNISFDLRDYLQYCSHFNGQVSLLWCAIHISQLSSIHKQYIDTLEKYFPNQILQWRSQLQLIGKYKSKDYLPLIVHPWHYKHIITGDLKPLVHEKLLLGPLNKDKMYACFDPCYLMTEDGNGCLYQTDLFKQPDITYENQDRIQQQLKINNHFDLSIFCLFKKTGLELKYNQLSIQTNFFDSTGTITKDCELVISLNNLLSANIAFSRPLLLELCSANTETFMHFFQSLLDTFSKAQAHLLSKFNLHCSYEHILMGFNENSVSKIIFRNPTVSPVTLNNKKSSQMDAILQEVLDCYFKHTGDRHTYNIALNLMKKNRVTQRSSLRPH